jgi:hypothetical protein
MFGNERVDIEVARNHGLLIEDKVSENAFDVDYITD